MQGAIIIRWAGPKPGHEVEAMGVADAGDAYFTRLAEEGRVAGHEWLNNVTGVDGGVFIARGDPEVLMGVTTTPEFIGIHLAGFRHLEGWHWDLALAGAVVDEVYPGWRAFVGA